jgi:SAM-dependent methyltransferase
VTTEAPGEPDPLHRDRARASSFGANAELYDRTRPRYPDALIDDLCAGGPRTVLDVGCGTGLLGRSFAERGLEVTGVEPDAQMAAVARAHGLDVEVATFESWEPRGRRFDLLVAGQSWHWVDPVDGEAKARAVVGGGGLVVHAWNVGGFQDEELAASLDRVYATLAEDQARPLVPHRRDPDARVLPSERAFADDDGFEPAEHRDYPWRHTYTTAEWLAQLETHSDHALMPEADRASLLAAVGREIDARGGRFVMRYDCETTRFRRRTG